MNRWIGKQVQFTHADSKTYNSSRYRGELLWLGMVRRDQGPDWLYAVLMDEHGVLKTEDVNGMRLREAEA